MIGTDFGLPGDDGRRTTSVRWRIIEGKRSLCSDSQILAGFKIDELIFSLNPFIHLDDVNVNGRWDNWLVLVDYSFLCFVRMLQWARLEIGSNEMSAAFSNRF